MVSFLFSFHGRINRASYWLGNFVVGVVGMVAIGFVVLTIGTSGAAMNTPAAAMAAIGSFFLLLTPITAVMAWCGLALQVKRFHDRGRSGWFAAIPFVLMALLGLEVIGSAMANVPGAEFWQRIQPYMTIGWIVNFAFFVDLGCLGSVQGPNKFGNPPPGAGAAAAPTPVPGTPGAPKEAPASASLVNAQSAMDRAIAERARAPQAQRPQPQRAPAQAPSPAPAPSGAAAPSFGRRVTR